jgi:hypothetical protein
LILDVEAVVGLEHPVEAHGFGHVALSVSLDAAGKFELIHGQ